MLCGGIGVNTTLDSKKGGLSKCFILAKNGTWVKGQGMKKTRMNARAVDTSKGWWVTGGVGGDKILSSTEVWDGKSWKSHVKLPKPLHNHCLVKINSTHYFITGGLSYLSEGHWMISASVSSYIFND